MAATYNPALLTDLDRARFMLGDTDVPDGALIPDETYEAAFDQAASFNLAVADLATGLASRFALEPDSVSISGEVSVSWRQRVEVWVQLAARLRAEDSVVAMTESGLISVAAARDDAFEPEYAYRVLDELYGRAGGINSYA